MKESLDKALKVLRDGGIILYPTDTVWGVGCDATNQEAVKKIYKLKNREDAKAMLMLVGSEGQLQKYVKEVPDAAWMLIDAAVNPLTIIYDTPRGIAENLLAPDGSAGYRISSDPFSKTLCLKLGCPIVSTSANSSGNKTPKNFSEIEPAILEGVDYVVEFHPENKGASPSNIIKVSNSGVIKIIR